MTCAACVGNVMHAVSDVQGVSDVAVNLLGHSATAVLETKDLVPAFLEAVEDGGYEAALVSIQPLLPDGADDVNETGPREISLKVEGMFCR